MKTLPVIVAACLVSGCSTPESYEWFRSTTPVKIQMYYSEKCSEAGYAPGSAQNADCTDKAMREGWNEAKKANDF
ncbi:hypothetical protein [Tropicimonas marinistellae]|uniref:hypothetical protein n=1 Tax=Tropicimonas marinistellae TaxID=1739787 RepID=UPI00122E5495|nr:hypothetical protein [Tropicimonas marinistellae]